MSSLSQAAAPPLPATRPDRADIASRDASIALGLTLPTDTVLYLLLPLHAADFGVSLAEAGLLLAANRLVRILGYGFVARSYERQGPRVACTVAVVGAAASSLGYALLPGVWWLLAARLVWGLSFAAMNIATQALATAEPKGAARRSGKSPRHHLGRADDRAAGRGGAGGMGRAAGGLPGAGGGGPARPALRLAAAGGRWRSGEGAGHRDSPCPPGWMSGPSSRASRWTASSSSAFRSWPPATMPEGAVLAAGAALALRYLAEVVLGPPGGALAERVGAARLLVLLSLASAAGLLLIGFGALWTGAVLVVLLRGLLQPLPAPVAAAAYPGPGRVPALARLATWRDLGAGLGPLAAGLLLPVLEPWLLYGGTALALAMAAVAVTLPRRR